MMHDRVIHGKWDGSCYCAWLVVANSYGGDQKIFVKTMCVWWCGRATAVGIWPPPSICRWPGKGTALLHASVLAVVLYVVQHTTP